MANLFFSEQKPKRMKKFSPSAVQMINWKDKVCDKLRELGFDNVSCSDNASPVIMVKAEADLMRFCLEPIYNLKIVHGKIPSRPDLAIGMFSLGKRNLRAFELID